ncbi:MAG TPA: type IV secretion system DNA-binding domain-containing protein, partial [Steroidobacteraceae bacterium]
MSAAGVMQSVGQLRGWWGLVAAYASVQVPMFVGLARGRAPFGKYIASPVVALPLTLVAAVGVAAAAPLWHGVSIATAATMAVSTGVALSATLGYAAGRYYTRRGPPAYVHRRGALLADPAPAVRSRHQLRARSLAHSHGTEASRIALAGVAVTPADEVKHFKLIGTTGTGKSTAIHELLRAALARGDRAVIADPDGGYVRRFYDPKRGDAILNPFDPASARWDLFGEINNDYDVEQLARSLIPDHEGSDRSWRGYARTFFSAVTAQAHAAGTRDVSELYRLLVVAGTPELKALVGGTPAQPFLEEHNGRMFDSIRSVTSSAVSSLAYISRQRSTPLAVRDWVRASAVAGEGASPHGRGALFMPYKAGQVAALRSTISAWM